MYKYITVCCFILGLMSCRPTPQMYSIKGEAFGSYYFVKYVGSEDYSQQIDSIIQEVDRILSTYKETSQLSKWNQGNDSIPLHPYILFCFDKAVAIHAISDGYYDPSVAPLVNAYGFGSGKEIQLSSTQKDSILQCIGLDKISKQNQVLIKKDQRIQLDFNSLAPGYTADLISQFLSSKKVTNHLVDIGGEVVARGTKPSNIPWEVGIETPNHSDVTQAAIVSIPLTDQALATSGNYRKLKTNAQGKTLSHTINPKTGEATTTSLVSVSIIAEDGITADALATACLSMGEQKTKEFLGQHPSWKAFLIIADGNAFKTEKINGF